MQETKLQWRAYEYNYVKHDNDWYWSLGILTLAFAITAVILNNILFAVFIAIASFSIALHSKKPPEVYDFELGPKGVRINNKIYLYKSLQSFWVKDEAYDDEIIFRSEKAFMPYIVIPMGGQNPEIIRNYLLDYLPEEEMAEPFSHRLLEYLGI